MSFYLKKTWLNFKSDFLHQNNPKSQNQCKNKLIYITTEILKPFIKLAVLYSFFLNSK